MVEESIREKLWGNKFTIILIMAFAAAIVFLFYYYSVTQSLGAQLNDKQSAYDSLNDKYNKLTFDHNNLVTGNNDLNKKYNDLNDRYNKLSVDHSYLQSSFDIQNNTLARFVEGNGPSIALRYNVYTSGSGDNAKRIVEATAYNVGDRRDDRIFIRCKYISGGAEKTDSQEFDAINSLEKRSVRWQYSNDTSVESVWVET